MKTEIKKFCNSLEKKLTPFSETIESSAYALRSVDPKLGLGDMVNGVLENRKDLSKLIELIQNEEAYLLIFGPLKSGKSTLMNAISGTYVSEVSSLPAYPCLVYVRNSKNPEFSLSRYDGTSTTYPDNSTLQQVVRDSHRELATAIQKTEEAGQEFQPEIHHKQSIKRVDIGLPATELEQSAVVMVDTPGLFAKMRFGYDRMTKEFKDRAACALFVVKADNLFLEPVFDEFNDLLASFSRIFLIVNTDHSKRDLTADGRLRPSLESTAPDQIIEAFRSLAMNASIRKAFEDGRLNVYPIDLLHSAQKILRGENHSDEEAMEGEEDAAIGHSRFESLCDDLENYLNGSDYIKEFRSDMMRRVKRLEMGLERYLGESSAHQMDAIKDKIRNSLRSAEKKVAAIDNLREIDWNIAFDETIKEHDEALRQSGATYMDRILQKTHQVIDAWFDSDESLFQLEKDRLEPLLEREIDRMLLDSREKMKLLLSTPLAGARFSHDEIESLEILGIDLGNHLKEILGEFNSGITIETPKIAISVEKLPIRRVWIDYLLFRTKRRVCKSLFGNLHAPSKSIEPGIKHKRLGLKARDAMLEVLRDEVLDGLIDSPRQDGLNYLREFVSQYRNVLSGMLNEQRESNLAELADLKEKLKNYESVEKIFAHLRLGFIDLQKAFLHLK